MSVPLPSFHSDADYPFLSTMAAIRLRAQQHMQRSGSASPSAPATQIVPPQIVLQLLGEALAFELARMHRYRKHAVKVSGTGSAALAAEFLQFSQEEQFQAARIAERIVQLDGQHEANSRSVTDYCPPEGAEDETLTELVEEDLIAERIAADSYREIIQHLSDHDAATRPLLESVLAVAEQHMTGLADMRERLLRADRAIASRSGEAQRTRSEDQSQPE